MLKEVNMRKIGVIAGLYTIDNKKDTIAVEGYKNGLFAEKIYGSKYNIIVFADARSKQKESLLLFRAYLESIGYNGQIYYVPDNDEAGMNKKADI